MQHVICSNVCRFSVCQIEQLKQELNKKEAEMQGLQTKLETLTNQNSDCKQHIDVLKESLSAKEQRANTLQTEVRPKHTHARSQNTLQTRTAGLKTCVARAAGGRVRIGQLARWAGWRGWRWARNEVRWGWR